MQYKLQIVQCDVYLIKKDLIYISKNTFNFNVNDSSNLDDKFLRVKGGFLSITVNNEEIPHIKFTHHDVEGNAVNELRF